jgi:hypothetical protein
MANQKNVEASTHLSEEEWLRAQLADTEPLGSAGISRKPQKKSSNAILLLAVTGALAFTGFVFVTHFGSLGNSKPNDSDDLGQGILNSSGLRGHLVTRWQDKKTQYQLKIEPIDATANAGFALVTGSPTQPISINVRVLDASGFALCGKEILLPFDPGKVQANPQLPKNKAEADAIQAQRAADTQRMRAQEQQRESGRDVFQTIAGSDGKIEALWAQGTLPCAPDQYKKFDYWDLTSNFPTLAVQQDLLDQKKSKTDQLNLAELRAYEQKRKTIAAKKGVSAFYIEGSDRISSYEPARALLVAGPGHSFFIDRKSDQTIAAQWAADSSLIQYKCDQHAVCALRNAGSPATVIGRMNE